MGPWSSSAAAETGVLRVPLLARASSSWRSCRAALDVSPSPADSFASRSRRRDVRTHLSHRPAQLGWSSGRVSSLSAAYIGLPSRSVAASALSESAVSSRDVCRLSRRRGAYARRSADQLIFCRLAAPPIAPALAKKVLLASPSPEVKAIAFSALSIESAESYFFRFDSLARLADEVQVLARLEFGPQQARRHLHA